MCLRCLFIRVASASRAAFHAKTQTLGGAPQLQSRFQAGLELPGLVLDSPTSCQDIISSRVILYADRTELSRCYAIQFAYIRREGLIFIISGGNKLTVYIRAKQDACLDKSSDCHVCSYLSSHEE